MNIFLEKFHAVIHGVVEGFDRLIFKGHLTSLFPQGAFGRYLSKRGVLLKDARKFFQAETARIVNHAKGTAGQAGRPYVYLESAHTHASGQSKEAMAQEIAQRDQITEGLVCIFAVLEVCSSFAVMGNSKARRLEVVRRSRWSVALERTVCELQGQPCINLENAPPPKQQIACTRSFGRLVQEIELLIEAVSEFASRAAEKLRKQSLRAAQILVFAHTSPFRPGPRFSQSTVIPLRRPSADTRSLVQAAVLGIKSIYKPGYQLSKAGVMLLDLMPDNVSQAEFDFDAIETRDTSKLMSAVDAINARFGCGSIHVGSAVVPRTPRKWSMRQERLTPQYTTKWSDMPVARA